MAAVCSTSGTALVEMPMLRLQCLLFREWVLPRGAVKGIVAADWAVSGILEMSRLLPRLVGVAMPPVWLFPATPAPSKGFLAAVAREHWLCHQKVGLSPALAALVGDKVLDAV